MKKVLLDSRKLAKEVTIDVEIKQWRVWGWRLRIASWLVCLAAKIAWLNMNIVGVKTVIDFDLLQKIKCLDNRMDATDLERFGPNTCFDYIDSLICDGKRYGVVVFVEPCGDITRWAESWDAAIAWWMAVFRAQPKAWDYITAGWHLWHVANDGQLPDDPQLVWLVETIVHQSHGSGESHT